MHGTEQFLLKLINPVNVLALYSYCAVFQRCIH
jgi:hypothetical protein